MSISYLTWSRVLSGQAHTRTYKYIILLEPGHPDDVDLLVLRELQYGGYVHRSRVCGPDNFVLNPRLRS